MAKVSEFKTDVEGAEKGKWFTLRAKTDDSPALRVRIRASTSKTYRTAQQKLQRQYRGKFIAGHGVLSTEDQDEFDVTLCVNAVVVGWEGLEADDGTAIPYSRQNVKDVLTEFAQLRREIFAWAQSEENFRPAELVAEELKDMGKT